MREALAGNDAAAIRRLYAEGGMDDLASIERLGALTERERRQLNAAMAGTVNGAVEKGTKDSVKVFEMGNPEVRVKEVLVCDSGSSARGTATSVFTDYDKTVVPVFEPSDVDAYAFRRGITPAEAHAELTQQYRAIHEKAVASRLPDGLKPKDVGYKTYGGFGSASGQADSYPAGYAKVRQSTQGTTAVHTPDGGVKRATGQHGVEAWEGQLAEFDPKAPRPVPGEAPRIDPRELPGIASEQVKALRETADPKSVAKALDRLDDIAQRSEVKVLDYAVDEDLARLAAAIKKNPEKAAEMLEDAGLSMEEFADRALEEGRRLQEHLRGFAHAGAGAGG